MRKEYDEADRTILWTGYVDSLYLKAYDLNNGNVKKEDEVAYIEEMRTILDRLLEYRVC